MRFFWTVLAAVLMLIGGPSVAKDLALVVDQQDHRRLSDLRRDSRLQLMMSSLEQAGFEVSLARDATIGELRAAAFSFDTGAQGNADRIVILLRGHLVSDGRDTWLMGQEVSSPDRFDIGSKGLPLSVFETILGAAAGRAVLAVIDDPRPLTDLVDLNAGAGELAMPQGATLLRGDSVQMGRSFGVLLQDGATTFDVSELDGGAAVSGFISDAIAFEKTTTSSSEPSQDMGEIAYWSAVRDIGTEEALNAYLNRFPNGLFATDARRQIQARVDDQEARIKAAEQALGLNRDRRRSIQRDLALLGYDPRGIDGVFGPASRRAIAAWQSDQGLEPHGFLDRDQLSLMQEFALRRAAELEEEARRRREIEEARDRAFWQDSGSRGTEEGYRRYLQSFPDGIFSDIAQSALSDIEEERRAALNAQERAAWDIAQDDNSVESYQRFLVEFPRGEFADVAQARIDELQRDEQDREAEQQFSAMERAVAGSTAARLLIERRLTDLGLQPGQIDGEFTRESRRALRRFQKARGLEVTGYVDQPTMVQLLLGR